MHDEKRPIAMTPEQLKELAERVATEMKSAAAGTSSETAADAGSHHRRLPHDLRERFIDVRAALFQRGIFDPVLVRFDSATAPQASTGEIADQLATIAASL